MVANGDLLLQPPVEEEEDDKPDGDDRGDDAERKQQPVYPAGKMVFVGGKEKAVQGEGGTCKAKLLEDGGYMMPATRVHMADGHQVGENEFFDLGRLVSQMFPALAGLILFKDEVNDLLLVFQGIIPALDGCVAEGLDPV